MFTVDELLSINHVAAENFPGKIISIKGVAIDSRIIRRGELFVAIKGERFDGHNFLSDAVKKGAACVVINEQYRNSKFKFPYIVVTDTTKALGELARLHRRKFNIPIVAITGSSGKTTNKDMTYSVLKPKYNVLCTQGNLNNHIGVPQTLFRLNKKHEIAVIEMGMNHAGEIQYLCEIAEPTHGLITNIGKAHIEFFRTVNKIAEAKGELFNWLSKERTRVGFVNVDDVRVQTQARVLTKKVTYSEYTHLADVQSTLQHVNDDGSSRFIVRAKGWKELLEITLKVPGVHNVSNALAAIAVGKHFDVPPENIRSALQKFKAIDGRMNIEIVTGVMIIDDAYNANPDSMMSALKTLATIDCQGRRICVLGDMLELGKFSVSEHRKIGAALPKHRCDVLLTFGTYAKCIHEATNVNQKKNFTDKTKLLNELLKVVQPGDVVLFKGSHGMKLKEVIDALKQSLENLPQKSIRQGKQGVN